MRYKKEEKIEAIFLGTLLVVFLFFLIAIESHWIHLKH